MSSSQTQVFQVSEYVESIIENEISKSRKNEIYEYLKFNNMVSKKN
jgi:hypothetical protein